jgi:hypothetical protein
MARTETTGHDDRRSDEDLMQDSAFDPDDRLSPAALKAEARRVLRVLEDEPAPPPEEETALMARWPDEVAVLSAKEREERVRQGLDTVLYEDPEQGRRGFVRAVLRVPLEAGDDAVGQTYGVFVEVDREGYMALKEAFREGEPTRVWGKLATRLPLLEDAFGSAVEIEETGGDRRAQIVTAEDEQLKHGVTVGPS